MNAKKEAVIKEIRCLIATCKNGLYMKRLWREYKETTGEYIPFREFGFDSMEQFLRSTNQFILRSCDGDFVLMAKPTEESAHILKLIQNQNYNNKKRSDPPRFIRPNYSSGSQQRNYGSSSLQYGNRSTRYQPTSTKPSVPFARNTNTNNNNYSNSYSQVAAPVSAPPINIQTSKPALEISFERPSTNPFLNDGLHTISMAKPIDDPCKSQSHQSVQRQQVEENQRENGHNEKAKRMSVAFGIAPARSEHSFDTDQSNNNMHSTVQREQARRMAEENEMRNMVKGRETKPTSENIFNTLIPARSRIDRSKLFKQTMLTDQVSKLCLDTKPKVNIQSRLQSKSPNTSEPEPMIGPFDFTLLDACESAVEAISLYCLKKMLSTPSYEFVLMKTKKFICSVEVNEIRYGCYPNEYDTKKEAQKAAAEIALLEIKELEESKKYPVCKDSPHDIAEQINACIGENGVFLDALQTVFQSTYQQSLPKDWRLFIQDNADLFEMNNMEMKGKAILYSKRPKLVDSQTNPFHFRPIHIDQIKKKQLPWAKKEWNIFVSTIKSIDDVRGYLYAEDDKDNLVEMIESYELKLLTHERKEVIASNIRIGGFYYTTYIENNRIRVMRIQVVDVDHSRRKAQCYFIDLGEDELVSFDRIYVMDPSMLEVPAQAIRFSLADLDVFNDDLDVFECEAINLLFNNHLIAEIKTTENEYLCNVNDPMIKAIFHLKCNGNNNRINLNLKIAMAASHYFNPIELEDDRLVNATVQYVNEMGIIHCHLFEKNAIPYICQLIKQLTAKGIDSKYHPENLSTEDIYLVYDEYNEMWYRAMLVSLEPIDVLLFKFIDYGMVARVNIKNVYQLKKLSGILNAFPPQTFNVQLYNDRPKTAEFIKCLQRHLQNEDFILMDIIEKTDIPSVKIWKRIDGKGIIDIYKLCLIETNDDDTLSMSSAGRCQLHTIECIQRKFSSNA